MDGEGQADASAISQPIRRDTSQDTGRPIYAADHPATVRKVGIFTAQRNFQELFNCLEPDYHKEFLSWIAEEYVARRPPIVLDPFPDDDVEPAASDLSLHLAACQDEGILSDIAAELRAELPQDAMSPREQFVFPDHGENADCSAEATVHVDAFLFNDEQVDAMCLAGQLDRHICKDCKSRNIEPVVYISHSASIPQLRQIFNQLLPPLAGKTVVDVGSRLGNVLYGGHLLSKAAKLVGVEINEYFCKLTQNVLDRHAMADRCQVICANILDQAELLGRADVVVLNNVFEFFLPADEQIKIWKFLRESIRRRGCYILTVPSLSKTFSTLQLTDINLSSWVRTGDGRDRLTSSSSSTDNEGDGSEDETDPLDAFHLYLTI